MKPNLSFGFWFLEVVSAVLSLKRGAGITKILRLVSHNKVLIIIIINYDLLTMVSLLLYYFITIISLINFINSFLLLIYFYCFIIVKYYSN